MKPSSREKITVELHGHKSALIAHAQTRGLSLSTWARLMLVQALGSPEDPSVQGRAPIFEGCLGDRVELRLYMSRAQAVATRAAANRAGQALGAFVADLVASVPVAMEGGHRAELLGLLTASCAELSTFSRNLNHLCSLLDQGAYRAAEEYRPMLNTLGSDVRADLELLARALADLRPRGANGARGQNRGRASTGAKP